MEPASTIIKALGGPGAVSAACGVHRTRVWGWTQPREKRGTGGVIPYKHIDALLDYARSKGIKLSAADFAIRPRQSASSSSSLPAVCSSVQ